MPNKTSTEEYSKVMGALTKNKDKSFVKRVLDPDAYPVIENDDGSHSTHKMAYSEVNGKYVVYPTILYNGKELKEYKPNEALDHVMKTGNYIEFDTEKEADWFSQKYKAIWNK